jgi:hypothetical protein
LINISSVVTHHAVVLLESSQENGRIRLIDQIDNFLISPLIHEDLKMIFSRVKSLTLLYGLAPFVFGDGQSSSPFISQSS